MEDIERQDMVNRIVASNLTIAYLIHYRNKESEDEAMEDVRKTYRGYLIALDDPNRKGFDTADSQ